MKSSLFKVNSEDFFKGLISAVFAAVIFALGSIVHQTGFSLFTVDWIQVGDTLINAAVAAFVGYLGKNFISDSEGSILGSADGHFR